MTFNVNDTLTKNVYDSAQYGDTLSISLVQDSALTLQTITPSTATFNQQNISSTVFPVNDINMIVSNIDELAIAHEGDDSAFNRIYQWQPESYGIIYKMNLICAFGLNVSAHSAGDFNLDGVRMIVTTHLPDGTLIKTVFDKTVNSVFASPLSAIGTQIFITDIESSVPFEILANHPVRIQIIVNTTLGTGTEQVGILPLFCYNSEATNKIFTTSIFKMHIHPSLKNAYPVIRAFGKESELDYSGVTSSGAERGT